MQDSNLLDINNPIHIQALQYSFGPLIQYNLYTAKKEWNDHRIRKQNNRNIEGGKPNILYNWPEKYNAEECKVEVEEYKIDVLLKNYSQKPELHKPIFEELVKVILPNAKTPTNADEALELYYNILEIIEMLKKND